MAITYKTLESDEIVGMSAIEIVSIPHISAINQSNGDENEIISKYKYDFANLLNEIYQLYKFKNNSATSLKDISIEILWKSTAVQNQPYKANIRLFFVVRAIDSTQRAVSELIDPILSLCKSTLSYQKYYTKELEETELSEIVASIKDDCIGALVKEESIEDLQNPLLSICYSFDRFPVTDNDLSRIVNALIDSPDCAVALQLIPTILYENELTELDSITQTLNTLSKGVMDQGVGNISFAAAEKHADNYRYYSEHKYHALYNYNILVYGESKAVTNITGNLYGQISAGTESPVRINNIILTSTEVNKDKNFYPLPWAVSELLLQKDRSFNIWGTGAVSKALYRFPYIITSEEACEFFRLPIGTERISAGLNINESAQSSKTFSDNIINTGDITVGILKASFNQDSIGFALNDLSKHMFVAGTPGSGKTTFSISLLDRLWKEHHIPFLVIEPAKNEYRALIQSIPDVQIFTPGKNFVSPFVYNPFIPPKNVKLESYKSTLKTAFAAGVSMTTPLDKIFEETINNCYSDFKWLDTYTVDDKGQIFNISDFIKCFRQTFEAIGYTGDARNIGRAGVVRLNSLVNLFDNYFSIPIEDILQRPTIIELAAIENSEQKALIIALLLLSVLSYVNANYIGEGGLKNVILLEEALVLLDAGTNAGQGDANPSVIAQSLVKRMLAEIRSYGVGLIIADQSPRKVGLDVVALTDMKVVFRLVENTDKQIIGDSTNMNDSQMQRLSKLKPGEAFLFYGKLDAPEEVVIPDYRLEHNISITLSDHSVAQLSQYWTSRRKNLRPYPQCLCVSYCQNDCDYNCRILAREISRRIYNKYLNSNNIGAQSVKKVLTHLTPLIKAELNDEQFDYKLLLCVRLHLLRKIKYDTKIKVSDEVTKKLLERSK